MSIQKCIWVAYVGKTKVSCDQTTTHPSGICDLHQKPEVKFNPSPGDHAVLAGSPNINDQELIGLEMVIIGSDPEELPAYYWRIRTLEGGEITIHRDAVWFRR